MENMNKNSINSRSMEERSNGPMVDGAKENLKVLGCRKDYFASLSILENEETKPGSFNGAYFYS